MLVKYASFHVYHSFYVLYFSHMQLLFPIASTDEEFADQKEQEQHIELLT